MVALLFTKLNQPTALETQGAAIVAAILAVLNPVKAVTDKLDDTLEDDAGTYRYTANALEQAPSGGGGGITVTDIWSHASRTLTASSDPSAAAIASQVRTELATELGRLDAAVSTRLADADYTAPDNTGITDIKTKTDGLTVTSGKIESDVKAVNGVAIQGAGITGNSWRPA